MVAAIGRLRMCISYTQCTVRLYDCGGITCGNGNAVMIVGDDCTRFGALHSRNGWGFAAGGDGYGLSGNFLAVPR